jgi:hypothetical protein
MVDDSGIRPSDEVQLQPTSVVRTPRRRALWGVLAVVAVAAGALAVTAGDDGAGPLPTLPVALGSTGGGQAAAESTPMAADKMMAWVTYRAGDGLPALGGEAPAYKLSGTVDAAEVQALADALGMAGQPTHDDGYWQLSDGDASLQVFEGGGGYWLYSVMSGMETGPGTATAEVVCDSVDGCTSTGSAGAVPGVAPAPDAPSTSQLCPADASCVVPDPMPEPPAPPADLPSEDEARQIALDLLAATGMDVDGAKVTVDGPYDAWYVAVEPVLDGLSVSGWMSVVSVGSKGVVTSASGTLATAQRLGDYPLIDTRAAIERLNEQGFGFGSVMPLDSGRAFAGVGTEIATTEIATTEIATTDVAVTAPPVGTERCTVEPDGSTVCMGGAGGTGGGSGDGIVCPSDDPAVSCPAEVPAPPATVPGGTVEPMPLPEPYPMPEPEPVEITLTGAEIVLVVMPAADGSNDVYLLPGYRFTGEDGSIAEVAAVADESLLPTPSTTLPDAPLPTVVEPPTSLPAVPTTAGCADVTATDPSVAVGAPTCAPPPSDQ